MKVVMRTRNYTIYRKRNQRYAVRDADKQWVHGADKVAILLAHNLVEPPMPQAPDHPEPAAGETAQAPDTGGGESTEPASGEEQQGG